MPRIAVRLVAAASLPLLAVASWILIPPPNGLLVPVAVGAPEVSPVLLAGSLFIAAVCIRFARRERVARLGLGLAAVAAILSAIPLAQIPRTIRAFDEAMANTTAAPPGPLAGPVRVTTGVVFSNADGVPLSLNVYQPPKPGRYPVILQIYGGSWQAGDPTNREMFSRYFAQRGYVVVAPDYRHAPEWRWPEQIVDIRTALYWVSESSPKFDADPSRIVVIGRSAGAQLAMRLAYQEGPSSIRGVVNFYGPVDLLDGWQRPPRPDPLDIRGILETFLGGTPQQKPEHYRHASPITWVSRASAPTLSLYGARDHVVEARFGRQLDAAMKKAGATSVLLELPWAEHAFDAVPLGIGTLISRHYVERFVAWAVSR